MLIVARIARATALLFIALITTIDCGWAQGRPADILIRLDKAFWVNVAEVISPISLPKPFSGLSVIDAKFCDGDNANVNLIVLLFQGSNLPAQTASLADADCTRPLSDVINDPKNSRADAAAMLSAAPIGDHSGLRLNLPGVAPSSNGHISGPDLEALKSFSTTIGTLDISPQLAGTEGPALQLTADLRSRDLMLYVIDSALAHLGDADSRPVMQGSVSTGNSRILSSHNAITFVVNQYLSQKTYPIKNTPFVVSSPSYSASTDSVSLTATVQDSEKHLSFQGSITWQGNPLMLSQASGHSTRNCEPLDIACKAKQAAENLSGAAFTTVVKAKYSGTPMLPSTGAQKIVFQIAGRKYFLELSGKRSQSQSDALFLIGNLYLGVQP